MNPQGSNAGGNPCFCIICYGDCAKCSEVEKELVPKFFKELGLYCYSQNQLRKLCSLDKETVDGMIAMGILGTCKTCLVEMKDYCGIFAVGRGRGGDLKALNGKVSIIQNKLEEGFKMHATLEGLTFKGVLDTKPELWDMFQKIKSFKERLIEKCSMKLERYEAKLSLQTRRFVAGTQTKKKIGAIKRFTSVPSKPDKKTGQDGGTSSLESGKSLPLVHVGNREKKKARLVWAFKNYKKTQNGSIMCNDCGRIYKNYRSYRTHLYLKRCSKDHLGQKSDAQGSSSHRGFQVEAKKARAAHGRERQENPTPKQNSEEESDRLSERDEELLKKVKAVHMKSITDKKSPFKCRTCDRPFDNIEAWEAHNREGHPVDPPLCEACSGVCFESRADWLFGLRRCELNVNYIDQDHFVVCSSKGVKSLDKSSHAT